MGDQSDKLLGLVVLYEGETPNVDIVAVHGLGADPAWAWVRKVGGEGTGQHKVNWLADKDLLPAKTPHARIMTFNYESKWHRDAPKQRRALCADQLLTALDNQRKEEKDEDTKYRPLIFIGHSFGGIVIEQALVSANSRGKDFQYLATATIGIIFLGTPHRGTKASKWAEWIARYGKELGFGTEDAILKDLREDCETLNDLVHDFTLWLFRMSVPTVCCFEQHKTDYGKRVGGSWKEMLVEEKSACIDGHRKVALPTDHFKINKYDGPEDYSYKIIYPIIKDMIRCATEKVRGRLKPRAIIQNNSIISAENLNCVHSLFLTNPPDDLAAIRRSKGKRVEGTCEWVLLGEEYTAWLVGDSPRMLRLVGAPGIGKTMISSYLVEELEKRAQVTSDITFAYYFCDNKDDKRNTAIAVIRGLLLQLLRQRPLLFKHVQEDYKQMKDQIFNNFDSLWRILLKILKDPDAGHIYFLIDALDECDKSPRGFRQAFLTSLVDLFAIHQASGTINVKFLITCRPDSDILDELEHLNGLVRIDSGRINDDLFKYIQTKVDELSRKKKYPQKLRQDIQVALSEKAGGTFLWVSLVLSDISETTVISKVREKLRSLPSGLSEVYNRILDNIQENDVENARFILQWVVIAPRPLTVDELAMARALGPEGWDKNTVPTADILDELEDGFKVCEPLIYLDSATKTVNLVHQSAKDYLLGENFQAKGLPSAYRIVPDKANLCILEICLRYLSMEDFSRDTMIIGDAVWGEMTQLSQKRLKSRCLLQYAIEEWQGHALAASPAVITDFAWESDLLSKVPILRDRWLQRVAGKGDVPMVVRLLAANADVNDTAADEHSDQTALQAASEGGHLEVVKRLLAANANVNAAEYNNQTALQAASEGGHLEVVKKLLTAKADVNATTKDNDPTALQAASKGGHLEVVKRLLAANADVNSAATRGQTALQAASRRGHLEIVKRLLIAKADVNTTAGYNGRTALQAASENGHLKVVKRLLEANADVNAAAAETRGRTALQAAAEYGRLEVVKRLLAANADVNAAGVKTYGRTALQAAAEYGYLEIVERLLDANADVNAAGAKTHGRTALQAAAGKGHLEVVERLLAANADVNGTADYNDWTALHAAAGQGHLEVVERLLVANADVNSGAGDQTALQAASERGHLEVVERLLVANADVNAAAAGYYGRTALQTASNGGHLEVVERLLAANADVNAAAAGYYGRTALQTASEGGHLEVVERLLAANADVNAAAVGNHGRTALQTASERGHLEVVERLLAANADVNAAAVGNRGRTALQAASEGGHLEVVERLLAANADVNAAASHKGWTALHAAAVKGHLEVVKRLLAANADVNAAASHEGRTALHAAAQKGHLEVVERLLAANADVNAAVGRRGQTALQAAAGNEAVIAVLRAAAGPQ